MERSLCTSVLLTCSPLPALLAGICCLGLILFLIAATIVLSLIPIYTPTRDRAPATGTLARSFDIPIANDTVLDVGDLNAQQRAVLQRQVSSTDEHAD